MNDSLSKGIEAASGARWTAERRTFVLIVAVLALRFVFAAATGLGIDESYTVATSRVLTLSTFDHPPLAWWIAHFAAKFLGESALALRAPFVLLSGVTSFLMFALTRRLFSAQAGFYAVFALALSPALGVADAVWILPDAPLLPAMLACAIFLARVFFAEDRATVLIHENRLGANAAPSSCEGSVDRDKTRSTTKIKESSRRDWLMAGFFAGLAMLSKYHGVLLFGGAGLFVLLSPRQRFWLATPWPWLAGLVALIVFSPVLIWNAQHHWVSFLFQGGRPGAAHLHLVAPLALIGLQSLFLAPWIFFPLAALFLRALWRGPSQERDFFLACLAAFPIVLFTLIALWSSHRVLPHWAAPGYLMIFPLLGRELAARVAPHAQAIGVRQSERTASNSRAVGGRQSERQTNSGVQWLRRALAAATAFTLLAAGAVVALPHAPLKMLAGKRDPLIETLGWRDFTHALDARGWRKDDMFIAATRWFEAGKLDVALHGDPPVLCLCDDPRGFGIIRDPQNFVGRDALIVGQNLSLAEARARFRKYFDSVEPLAPVNILAGGEPAIVLDLYRATRFHDPAPEFSLTPPKLAKTPPRPQFKG
jgi:4-amino-4-deoxy-L-arabinose transferase-like glycosyltransferase